MVFDKRKREFTKQEQGNLYDKRQMFWALCLNFVLPVQQSLKQILSREKSPNGVNSPIFILLGSSEW